ncbi:energy transducer TonB [Crenobacter cavernae]|uniref:TonB C-terminal domain-containing protein n=1 Tax=Crenobacter cavernae TaxID=2290923 RepID=A0A345Y795_9NEIS|nr:energy transducer TonB [Crenobacter cavernae]AXK39797.1 hypothetical protein DWG20_10295 [Crenobacter cavernae]
MLDTPLGFGDAVYYPAPMLDAVAEPLAAIDPLPMPPDPDLDPGAVQAARLVIRVFIDEAGRVVATEVESAEPPGVLEEAALAAFGKATFAPAIRHGQKVKSVKRIAIESGGLSSPF